MRDNLVAEREKHREQLRAAGHDPYPTWNRRTHTAADVRNRAARGESGSATVAGRLVATREHGGIRFLDLKDATGKVQVLCRADRLGDTLALLQALDPNDVIAAEGEIVTTQAGEISIDASAWTLLAKALLPPPEKRAGLKDEEERARRREVDLLANPATRTVFDVRATVMRGLRTFLLNEGFTEVETPILQHLAGGAAARPFRTHHRALDLDLSLRIAPELYLKRLVVGGYEKVFELGRVFRNEGIDRQHNPEFTACELYQAYATVEDLIPLTERLFTEVLTSVHGRPAVTYQGREIDFTPPWPRTTFAEAVKKATGVDVLAEREPAVYLGALRKLGVAPPWDLNLPNLMDELMNHAVRKSTIGPLLVLDAPIELVPLAKRRPDEPRLSQRVQLLAAGMELVNAYTEENDPVEQEARFRDQARLRGATDIYPFDAEYLEALRVGLPPTAGWGLGVDRLVMLTADRPSIRDVLYFPLLRPRP